jgi:hypothetical protein
MTVRSMMSSCSENQVPQAGPFTNSATRFFVFCLRDLRAFVAKFTEQGLTCSLSSTSTAR